MATGNFPNHSGGVVQVFHTARYGAVPESLLEDHRLGLDTRAVAAWLAIKASGWQINVGYLRSALALPGKSELGKDIWQRIATELELTGYLYRTRQKGQNGQWVWHITFNPVPGTTTIAGSAGYGSAGNGRTGHGLATCGQPGHKTKQQITIPIKKTTTNRLINTPGESGGPATQQTYLDSDRELVYPIIHDQELDELKKLISSCAPRDRQQVLDEIEGIRQSGGIKKGAIPLCRALIQKLVKGEFILSAGNKVQSQRAARLKHDSALAASAKFPAVMSSTSEGAIAQLPLNLQIHMRAAQQRIEAAEKVD